MKEKCLCVIKIDVGMLHYCKVDSNANAAD